MEGWTKCNDWKSLPMGRWLVKVNDEIKPYQVAYAVEGAHGCKIVTVGSVLSFDSPPLIAYRSIPEINDEECGCCGELITKDQEQVIYDREPCHLECSIKAEEELEFSLWWRDLD